MSNTNTQMDQDEEKQKYFPIFYKSNTPAAKNAGNIKPKVKTPQKFRGLAKDQMLLDAGQKKFGLTMCHECNSIYHMGDPGDEIMHLNYHSAIHIFRFQGWKNERILFNDMENNGRVIQILPNDSKIWWKRVREVLDFVNRDLGFYEMQFQLEDSQIFFYIKHRTIVGVLVAEPKSFAHRLLTTKEDQVDLCSEASYTVKCGVSRIWVSQNYRQKGIGSALMDCLKKFFCFGTILHDCEVAFSSPTALGKAFGTKYFKKPDFLIYM